MKNQNPFSAIFFDEKTADDVKVEKALKLLSSEEGRKHYADFKIELASEREQVAKAIISATDTDSFRSLQECLHIIDAEYRAGTVDHGRMTEAFDAAEKVIEKTATLIGGISGRTKQFCAVFNLMARAESAASLDSGETAEIARKLSAQAVRIIGMKAANAEQAGTIATLRREALKPPQAQSIGMTG